MRLTPHTIDTIRACNCGQQYVVSIDKVADNVYCGLKVIGKKATITCYYDNFDEAAKFIAIVNCSKCLNDLNGHPDIYIEGDKCN